MHGAAHVRTVPNSTFAMRAFCGMLLLASAGCGSDATTSMDGSTPESGAPGVDSAPALDALDAPAYDAGASDVAVSMDSAPQDSSTDSSPQDSSTDSPPQDSSTTDASVAPPDAGAFACADGGMCDVATEFCQLVQSGGDTGAGPAGQCLPLPAACLSAPSCNCLITNQGSLTYPVTAATCTDTSGQIIHRVGLP